MLCVGMAGIMNVDAHKASRHNVNKNRPILSGFSGSIECISSFLDHIIKPLVSTTPSYVHQGHPSSHLSIRKYPYSTEP